MKCILPSVFPASLDPALHQTQTFLRGQGDGPSPVDPFTAHRSGQVRSGHLHSGLSVSVCLILSLCVCVGVGVGVGVCVCVSVSPVDPFTALRSGQVRSLTQWSVCLCLILSLCVCVGGWVWVWVCVCVSVSPVDPFTALRSVTQWC